MSVVQGPWGTVSPDEARALYLTHPNADTREIIEQVCPNALDGLDDVEEASAQDLLAELRVLRADHPDVPGIGVMVERLEERIQAAGGEV